MNHVSLPVTDVTRAGISSRATSRAPLSIRNVPADQLEFHHQRGIQHPHDTLSAVVNPAPPIEPPSTPYRSSHQTPRWTNGHTRSGVSPVPSRFDSAAEGVRKMTSGAWSLLGVWPVDGLMKLMPANWRPRVGDPAPQPGGVENAPQPNDVEDTADNTFKALQEEDMMDSKAPPPYYLPSDEAWMQSMTTRSPKDDFGDPTS
ncbi:hypothetical protein FRC01_002383 [Tulasnella sp. 417]|nr:hypothetical protein FRC01_002383 [Tulasnella sp. 417]